MPQIATVEFVPLRNDLANLPSSLASMLFSANIPAQQAVIELGAAKGDPVFCGWTGLSSKAPNTIELDPTFATNLGLRHGQELRISVKPKVPEAHSVLLEPVSVGDWEIVETHVAFLEAFMINQVRAVALNKLVTVFPSSTSLAALKVVRIDPFLDGQPVARLSPECEVIVAPKTDEKNERSIAGVANGSANGSASGSVNGSVNGSAANGAGGSTQPSVSVIRRSTIHPYLPGLGSRKLEIHGNIRGIRSGAKVRVSIAVPPVLVGSDTPASGDNEEIPHAKRVVATFVFQNTPLLGLSYGLGCALGIQNQVGTQVVVTSFASDPSFPSVSATIRPFTLTTSSPTAKLSLSKTESFLSADQLGIDNICKGMVIAPHPEFLPLGGIIDTEFPKFGVAKKLKLGNEIALAKSKRMRDLITEEDGTLESSTKPNGRPIVGQQKLLHNIMKIAENGNGILLYGSRGCGKSVMLQEIARSLKYQHVHPIAFKCGNYTDKTLPTLREALHKVSYEALWMKPSVIVFDDLDKLVPAQQEYNGDSGRQQQIAEVFCSILRPLILSGNVSVLASAQDQSSIHSFLLASHLLESVIHLKSPDKELREQILRAGIEADKDLYPSPHLDLLEVVAETEGYQPGDLWILVERLVSTLALREDGGDNDGMEVTTESLISAAADFTPASLRGVKLEKPAVNWAEIGGMTSAKNLVLETLEWPTKYAPIFAKCPLRLRSGLLFYGYPGCGKTMLASAIASKTGLNFISVKGPEILNKYIGASEQSVRDLFDRAQAAKPCVLFFDEFDSIAPKRGHDATGVTDRVVNQLLTQMDGAEGLDGVYVLAATSRPDMIDSALLRPGRLDKSVLCDMPDTEARLDILMRAAKMLTVKSDLDLCVFAEKTQGYSGADLQALIYNAYLKAVHRALAKTTDKSMSGASNEGKEKDDGPSGFHIGTGDLEASKAYFTKSASEDQEKVGNSSESTVLISNTEMQEALEESKPSISAKELARFASIYSEFSTDRNGEMPPGTSSNEIGGRVTLQ